MSMDFEAPLRNIVADGLEEGVGGVGDLGVRLDKAVDFDWLKFLGWPGFQSLVFENIPPPTFSGTEERWQTKVWLESSIVSYVIWDCIPPLYRFPLTHCLLQPLTNVLPRAH